MHRFYIILGLSFFILLAGVTVLYIWIGKGVRNNIEIAKNKYPGSAEDALIKFLQDENNSPDDRTHIAIWTLGQIDSKKALPVLKKLYENDPDGKTCNQKHDSLMCQYEIHKAIKAIENWRPMTYSRLKTE